MDELIRKEDALSIKFKDGILAQEDGIYVRADKVVEGIKAIPPVVQPEMTDEQFKDYCRKRCLSVVTNEFLHEVRKMVPAVQPTIIHCKDCKRFRKPSSIVNDDWGWCSGWHNDITETFVTVDGFCHRAEKRGEA